MILGCLARTADRIEANTRAVARQQSQRRPPLRAWIADWLRVGAPVSRNPAPLLAPTKTPHTVPGPLPVSSTGEGWEQANTRNARASLGLLRSADGMEDRPDATMLASCASGHPALLKPGLTQPTLCEKPLAAPPHAHPSACGGRAFRTTCCCVHPGGSPVTAHC